MSAALAQQNLRIQIQDDLKYDIRFENADLDSGQFYNEDDETDILTAEDVDDMVVRHKGGVRSICCMDESQGSVDLVDDVKDKKICSLSWRASTQPGESNEFKTLNQDSDYVVEIGKWNHSGTMGEIPVTISERS